MILEDIVENARNSLALVDELVARDDVYAAEYREFRRKIDDAYYRDIQDLFRYVRDGVTDIYLFINPFSEPDYALKYSLSRDEEKAIRELVEMDVLNMDAKCRMCNTHGNPNARVWNDILMSSGSFRGAPRLARNLDRIAPRNDVEAKIRAAGIEFVENWIRIGERLKSFSPIAGRKPAEKKTCDPEPDRFTCSCCFRSIARDPARRNVMSEHGYEYRGRNRAGGRTQGCFGVNYPPLEDSPEGLVKYVEFLKGEKDEIGECLRIVSENPENIPGLLPRKFLKAWEKDATGFPAFMKTLLREVENELGRKSLVLEKILKSGKFRRDFLSFKSRKAILPNM